MADENAKFLYTKAITNQNAKILGEITARELKEFSIPEFQDFMGNLYGVYRRKRRDTVVLPAGAISAGDVHQAFTKGYGQQNHHFGNKAATYDVTERHSNMALNGSFQQGDVTIVHAIEIPVVFPATKPTTVVDGIITDPTAVTNATNYDAAMMAWTLQKALRADYFELGKMKSFGNLEDYPNVSGGIVGYAGASPGGIAQNGMVASNILKKVRVLYGDMNFRVDITALQDYTLAPYGKTYGLEVILHTIELEGNNP